MSSSWEDVGVAVASMVLATFSMLDKPENVFLITFTGVPCFPISAIASPNSPTVEANFCRIPATLSTLDDGIFNAATGGSTVPLPNDPALFSSLTLFLASSALHPTMVGQKEKWKRPPETTFKLNMDAALAKETKTTGVGAISRGHNGQFVVAMMKSWKDLYQPRVAEAMGIKEVLNRVKSLRHIQIESDAVKVIDKIKAHFDWTSFDLIIEDIRQIAI
nr:uncharacterized protein LOC109169839 [Ipomoea batatas]